MTVFSGRLRLPRRWLQASYSGPAIATAAIKSVIDLIALFRTDVDIKTSEITPEPALVEAEIAKSLKKELPTATIINPAYYLPIKALANPFAESKLLPKLDLLYAKRQTATNFIAAVERKKPDQQTAEEKEKASQLKDLNTQFDKLNSALVVVDDKTGLSLLTLLLKGERIITLIPTDGSAKTVAVLFVKVARAGGANRVSRNLFTGSKVSHNGGSIVGYALFNSDGGIVQTGTLYCLTGFHEAEELEELNEKSFITNFQKPPQKESNPNKPDH